MNKKMLLWILPILTMIGMFVLSAQNVQESTKTSFAVGYKVGEIMHSDFETWSDEEKEQYAISVDGKVRKVAHALEFSIFAVVLFIALGTIIKKNLTKKSLATFAIVFLCALGDEVHQLFVAGRAFEVSDIVADCLGAGSAVILCYLVARLYRRSAGFQKNGQHS